MDLGVSSLFQLLQLKPWSCSWLLSFSYTSYSDRLYIPPALPSDLESDSFWPPPLLPGRFKPPSSLAWLSQEALHWSTCAHPHHFCLFQYISQNMHVFLLKLLHNLHPLHNPSDFIPASPSHSLTPLWPPCICQVSPGFLSCIIFSVRLILVTLFKIAKTPKSWSFLIDFMII